ncbi:MAG: glycosyltransferase [Hespellia sp.]|nr:glycosyltransferase [Hespellia sp.]
MEKISIIIPVYNVEQYLPKCLDSVKRQTYEYLEVILVDDGSTDHSGILCDQYADGDDRFQVIHKQHEGVLKARNIGLLCASGTYIGYVDADDWIADTMYETLYLELKRNHSDLVICQKQIYDETTGSIYNEMSALSAGVYAGEGYSKVLENLFCQPNGVEPGVSINLCDKLIKRTLLARNQGLVDERLRYFEDGACVIPCLLEASSITVLEEALYYYRQRSASACHSTDAEYLMQLNIFYQNIRERIECSRPELGRRLETYMVNRTYAAMNQMMGFGLRQRIPFYMPPLSHFEGGERIVIYGAGMVGRDYERMMRMLCPERLVGWVDRRYEALQAEGLEVEAVECLRKWAYDRILIAVLFRDLAERIREELRELGIGVEMVEWYPPDTVLGEGEKDT